ncbi:MAG: hypothetical protein KHX03_06255 [Clostridium sp.]|nr:hypothetical protein [Clostridium sp.]
MTFNFNVHAISPNTPEDVKLPFEFNVDSVTPVNADGGNDGMIKMEIKLDETSTTQGTINEKGILTYPNTSVYSYVSYICENFPNDTDITDSNHLLNENLMIKIRLKKYAGKKDGYIFVNGENLTSSNHDLNIDRSQATFSGNNIHSRWGTASGSTGNSAYNIPVLDNIYYDYVFKYEAENQLMTWQVINVDTKDTVTKSNTGAIYWKGILAIGSLVNRMPSGFFGEIDTNNCYFKAG